MTAIGIKKNLLIVVPMIEATIIANEIILVPIEALNILKILNSESI